tara:strand:- start:1457 stop:1702 length:246 start_codon:yes stop_codon:yes gene_type:complete
MKKTDIKVGTEFIYKGNKYTINSISPTSDILKDSIDYILHNLFGYCGGITNITDKGFQYYTVIMGDLFQKEILFKDCEINK